VLFIGLMISPAIWMLQHPRTPQRFLRGETSEIPHGGTSIGQPAARWQYCNYQWMECGNARLHCI